MSEIKYTKMFEPIKVGNLLLKSRFYASHSKPHSLQGPETWPAEGYFRHFINKAKNGAAYVVSSASMNLGEPPVHVMGYHPNSMFGHFAGIDTKDSQVQNYLCQYTDAIHFYGSKACMMLGNALPGYDVDDNIPPFIVMGDGGAAGFTSEMGKRISEKQMRQLADEIAEEACLLQDCGFDMVYMHSAYRLMLPARFLSKRTNTRTDEFGGSLENRSRYLFMICDRIKERCGKGFPIEVSFTAFDNEDPDPEKWWTLDDTREFVQLAKNHIDILQVRPHSVEYVHNMGFDEPLPTAFAAKAAHEAAHGEILISSVSGYNHPDLVEKALGDDGYLDLVGMARSFISNPDWGKLCKEGRGEDVVPCIKCNKCHRNSWAATHQAVCSVNPLYGIEHRIDYLKNPVSKELNIAVAGGGPAGMRAALFASANGHKVTLFEKSGQLGGLLNINRYCDFKWPVHQYNEWLKKKVEEDPRIDIRLNTSATQELLQAGAFDEVIAAIGGNPVIPRITGIDRKNVFYAGGVYGKEDLIGDKVVIIGGGDVGVETAFHLVNQGKHVFIIEMSEELMMSATPIHYRARYVELWEKEKTQGVLDFVCNATCTEITEAGVKYQDKTGEQFFPADTVIYSVGIRAKENEALSLYWPGKEIHLIGDCLQPGSIQTCNKTAFAAINSL